MAPAAHHPEPPPVASRALLRARLAGAGLGAASFAVFVVAWATGSFAWHAIFAALYVVVAGLIWVISAIPRKEQMEMDRAWGRRFHELAIRDDLTGLYNRRFFNSELERLVAECRANGATLTLALIDLNDFKAINDTYGHQAGDLALRLVGECIAATAGERAVVARTGGDEFAVILPATTATQAAGMVAALRRSLEQTQFVFDARSGAAAGIQAAVGLASLDAFSEVERLLHHADNALYEEKRKFAASYPRRLAS
jgi:diguanylate cyclase (GGDEF)-like protein